MMKRLILLLLLPLSLLAQAPNKTTITDTVFGLDGELGQGTLNIVNQVAFTSTDGFYIAGGTSVLTGINNGALSIALVPNTFDPSGNLLDFYVATYTLASGTRTENWIVPSSGSPVKLGAVISPVLPLPGLLVNFNQLTPPANCVTLGSVPKFVTNAGWTCTTTSVGGTNTYTGNQTASLTDQGKLVKMNCNSACAYTLPNPQPSNTFYVQIESTGSTLATVVLGSSMTFNGNATAPLLSTNVIVTVFADSALTTNYLGSNPGIAGGSNAQLQYNNNGAFAGATGSSYNTSCGSGSNCLTWSVANGGSAILSIDNTSGTRAIQTHSGTAFWGSSGLNMGGDPIALGGGALSGIGTIATNTNCSSSASPAVCSSAASGSVVVAAAATTVQVNTTAVSANSQIHLTRDDSLGSKLSVTCNTATVMGEIKVSARTAGTSFTITVQTAPATNPGCIGYTIVN